MRYFCIKLFDFNILNMNIYIYTILKSLIYLNINIVHINITFMWFLSKLMEIKFHSEFVQTYKT